MPRVSKKKTDDRIQRLYSASCSGVQIPIMSIGGIMDAARVVVLAGGDDVAVTAAIVDAVAKVRVN
jgi:thiamine monophosphate synthase